MIELRSDTFTLPTPTMLEAMVSAPLGDDVYGEDPTVRRLEERAAELTGMPAACLMPSGTMANLASLMAHAPRGSKVLVGDESDIYLYEAAGASVCGGVQYEPVPNQPDGTFAWDDLAAGFPEDPEDPQFALPSLICLENTQNRCGGKVLSLDYLRSVRTFADERGVALHLDGARLFNAAVALGVPAAEITAHVDSVQFCLSKGLGAPIGSMLAGGTEFLRSARRVRKMLGGGMRQAGVIAAAGIEALDTHQRLAEDHAHARRLAEGLATVDGVAVDPSEVQTNIVLFRLTHSAWTWQAFCAAAAEQDLYVAEFGRSRLRAVTHRGVTAADIDRAVDVIAGILRSTP
ncbi:GntG family PLP-dependent aldolase [Streptomyces sp. SR-10]|uniref:GntG family PLP-dependent aldolase n=1 Tax=Streptomyces sp. SR-10 TaxID=3416442 RepID=UPI003CF414F9